MAEEQTWYVITTRSRAEKKVAAALDQLGMLHYLPLQRQMRQWKDRKKQVTVPLFPSYIFVLRTAQTRKEVFQVPGVVRYLTAGEVPAVVRQEEIDRIARICDSALQVEVAFDVLIPGSEVEVISGPLTGLKGTVVKMTKNARLHISIPGLSCVLSVMIDQAQLRQR